MRLAASISLALQATADLLSGVPSLSAVSMALSLLALTTALLLLAGLWTPVAGVLAAVAAGWHGVHAASGLEFNILLGVLGIALALLGPGAWSVDARMFGWKRLEFQNETAGDSEPGNGTDGPSFR